MLRLNSYLIELFFGGSLYLFVKVKYVYFLQNWIIIILLFDWGKKRVFNKYFMENKEEKSCDIEFVGIVIRKINFLYYFGINLNIL